MRPHHLTPILPEIFRTNLIPLDQGFSTFGTFQGVRGQASFLSDLNGYLPTND